MKNNTSPAPAQMFVQINLQKSKQGQLEIGKRIRKMNQSKTPFICLVQEPMMYKNKLSLQPQSCNRYNHSTKPRTAIYTDKNTQAWYVESLSTGDITVIQTKIKNRSTMIISCYLDINIKEVIPSELNKALYYAQQHGLAVILGMDSNAHSSSFGSTTNKRGEQLDLFIAHHKLDIENQGLTPTFQARGAQTIIDITLTARLSVSVTNWNVCLLYTSPSPRDLSTSRMPSSA